MPTSRTTTTRVVTFIISLVLAGGFGFTTMRSADAAVEVHPQTGASQPRDTDGFLDGFLDSFSVGFLDGFLDGANSASRSSLAAQESTGSSAEAIVSKAADKAGVTVRKITTTSKGKAKVKTAKMTSDQAQGFLDALRESQEVASASSD